MGNKSKVLWVFEGGPLDGLVLDEFDPLVGEISVARIVGRQRIDHVYTLATFTSFTGNEDEGVACFIHCETRRSPCGGGLEAFDSTIPAP